MRLLLNENSTDASIWSNKRVLIIKCVYFLIFITLWIVHSERPKKSERARLHISIIFPMKHSSYFEIIEFSDRLYDKSNTLFFIIESLNDAVASVRIWKSINLNVSSSFISGCCCCKCHWVHEFWLYVWIKFLQARNRSLEFECVYWKPGPRCIMLGI